MNDIHEPNQMNEVQSENPQQMNDTNEQNQMNEAKSPYLQQTNEAKKKAKLPGCSIACIIIAIFIFLLSFAVVGSMRSDIPDIENNLVSLEKATVLPENEGKLVLVSGKLSVKNELKDNDFNVAVKTPKLERIVYMLQWEEDRDEDSDGDVTYTYSQVWSNALINSNSFYSVSRNNPKKKPIESKYFKNETYLGDFLLTDAQMERLETEPTVTELDEAVGKKHGLRVEDGSYTNVVGKSPKIGDIKIRFHYIDTEELGNITILAKQKGYGFEVYETKGKTKIDKFWTKRIDKAGVIAELKSDANGVMIAMYVMSGILIIIAIAVYYYKRG